MRKTLRILSLIFIALLMCASTLIFVYAAATIPAATSEFYVNDFAGVFTETEKNKLVSNAVTLANEHDGIQVVITTIKSLDGDSIENYAYNMYNQYGIGKGDMGLLILLATEDREIRVEVGRGMEGYINDVKAGRFMDNYAIPSFSENKFNEGLIALQEAFITEIEKCISSEANPKPNFGIQIDVDWGTVLFVLLIIVTATASIWGIVLIVVKVKKKKKEKREYVQELKKRIDTLNYTIDSRNTTIASLKAENQKLSNQLSSERQKSSNQLNEARQSLDAMENWHTRILAIYPDADKKVEEMIQAEKVAKDKETAKRVDKLIESVINLSPDKDLIETLESIKYEIDFLSQDEAQYLESDINRFNTLFKASRTLKREYDEKVEQERRQRQTERRKQKGAEITKQLLSIISIVGIARASHLPKLRSARCLYKDLDSETKSYVDSSAISKIEELFKQAKRDEEEEEARKRRKRQEEEEAERRRRQAMHNSTISRTHSSGHGGFGGRSGGGGSSRRF